MSATDIVLERETANDEAATVVAIHVASGSPVEAGTLLFEIENSKVTQELEAPAGGILMHALQIGQTVPFGVALAQIVAEGGGGTVSPALAPTAALVAGQSPPALHASATASEAPSAVYVSRAAAALMASHGLAAETFGIGFVTVADVQARLAPAARPLPAAMPPAAAPKPGGQPVSARKRAEIQALGEGAARGMLSVLGVTLGPMHVSRPAGDFLEGRITDLVIYEASRLMRQFPLLNAAWDDNAVSLHGRVHAGMAIDGGGKLMVFGIEDADRITLPALGDMMADAVARYSDNALTTADVTRATFTVTDLSASPLDFVLPLLPRGQSCIIGVTRSDTGGFRLFAGFDHRVTEGREVALFLEALRGRLLSFAGHAAAAAAQCGTCGQSAMEAVVRGGGKGLLKLIDRTGTETLCCASCWHGW